MPLITRRVAYALVVLAVLSVLAMVGYAILANQELSRRDNALTQLGANNASLQDQLAQRNAERQELLTSRETLRGEKADLENQRTLLVAARDTLSDRVNTLEKRDADQQRKVADLERQASDAARRIGALEKSLGDREKELRDVRSASAAAAAATPVPTVTPQPTAVPVPSQRDADVKQLVQLDDQIYAEFLVLLGHVENVSKAFLQGNFLAVQAAFAQGVQSGDRLKDLFARRAPILDRLR